MAKISKYPEDTDPNPAKFILVEGTTRDGKYKTKIGNLTALAFHNRMNPVWSDFVESSTRLSPLMTVAIAGTIAAISSEAVHPGILRVSSAAAANTGYCISLNGASAVLIGGGEVVDFVVRFPNLTNVIARLGMHDSLTTTAPVDAVDFIANGATVRGRTRSNNVETTTTSSYTISANTWYRMKAVVNSDATRVDFYIYNMSGTLLWTDSSTTNIPTGAGRETGFTALAYKTTIGATAILDVDWMAYSNTKVLTR